MTGPIGLLNKGIATGVGLAREKYYDHKDRKAALDAQGKEGNPEESSDEGANDERAWALDEAAGEPPQYEETEADKTTRPQVAERTVSELAHEAVPVRGEAFEAQRDASTRLQYPVVIPQRRPGTKARGFVRAYAPDLENVGIDEVTFSTFLHNFQESAKASPLLNLIWVSAGVVGFVPGVITMAVSISVQVAAGTAIELQTRYRANAFLDQVNKELFMPRGLYAMVLMYKKDKKATADAPAFGVETVSLETAKQVSKWGLPKENEEEEIDISKGKQILRPIRLVSGKTPQKEMPLDVAQLVYPGLDDMVERPDVVRDESFKERLQRNKQFVASYFDKRATALYQANNPDSALTKAGSADAPEFRSRWADPNHPSNNGHLFSLVTGGKYIPRANNQMIRPYNPETGRHEGERDRKPRGPIGYLAKGVRKVMAPNVLYLTIVNMPSEEEMAEARRALEEADKEGNAFTEMLKRLREGKSEPEKQ